MIPRRQFSLGIACAIWLFVHAAVAEYRFDVWTAESGLPQNSTGSILQSREGYLWLSTFDGVVRFDGVRFTVFNRGNSPGLPGNRITALYEDRDGDLWVGTEEGGLARYHRGRFTPIALPPDSLAPPFGCISGDEEGHLWVLSQNGVLRWKDGRFQPALPDSLAALFSQEAIRWNARGTIWVTNQAGLHLFARGKLTTLALSNGLPSLRVNYVHEDQHGTWWVTTEDAGLVKVKDGKVIQVFGPRDGLPGNRVAKTTTPGSLFVIVCEDRKGNLWIHGAGPWLGRLKDGVFTEYPTVNTVSSHPLPPASGSRGSHINALFEDRDGNLWIATDGSGLIRAREQAVEVLSTRQGLLAPNVYPICQDRSGAVWMGLWDQGLARFKDGVITNFVLESRDRVVTALCEDRAGRLWLGSEGGVAIFENGAITLAGVPPALSNHVVSAICQDRAGALWFGPERGLFRLQNGDISLVKRPDGATVPFATVIIEDHTGALWIGTWTGLTRLADGRFTTWTEGDGLPSNHVRSLYEDHDGTLWIGTYDGGLGRFKDGKFTRYTVKEGLFNNGVFQILEDARGNFWMSSNQGIHRVSKQELNEFAEGRRRAINAISYGKSDGMLNIECNGGRWPGGVKTHDGKLWFPTQDGVAVIDPEAMPTNPRPPPVVIESFLLEREPQALDRPVRVPPGKANIEIQYTGLSFVNSERLVFKYRLAGADDDWVEAGPRRTAYYSHVAPGHYTFAVRAANSDGLWNETGASLAFTVLPAWHQTAWFRALAIAAVCGVALAFYRRRITRLEAQRAAQQAFSRQLLNSQETERKRIAAELHDSLGQNLLIIKNRLYLAQQEVAGAAPAGQLAEISQTVSQTIEEVREISHNLRPYQLDRLGLTKAVQSVVMKVADSGALTIESHIASLDGLFTPEGEINLYRIVQESLSNILKHSDAATARLAIERDGGKIRMSIEDDGRGFDYRGTMTDERRPQGFGLTGLNERVRILGGRFECHSAPGEGTRLSFEIPVPPKREKDNQHPDG